MKKAKPERKKVEKVAKKLGGLSGQAVGAILKRNKKHNKNMADIMKGL
jgi:hypothetical protein